MVLLMVFGEDYGFWWRRRRIFGEDYGFLAKITDFSAKITDFSAKITDFFIFFMFTVHTNERGTCTCLH